MSYERDRRGTTRGDAAPASGAPSAVGKRTRIQAKRSRGPVQRKPADPAASVEPEALLPRDGGAALPEPVRGTMERSFGSDFSDVRVHEGDQAASIGALAYTSGSHLHFAPGQYDPASTRGQALIGHELAHVVQQRAGRVATPQAKGAPINSDEALEAEADLAGARAARGEPAGIASDGSAAGGAVQPKLGPIQRAVGFEFELGSWDSKKTSDHRDAEIEHGEIKGDAVRLDKGEEIAAKPKYKIEGEDTGDHSSVEFVFKPLVNRAEALQHIGEAQEIAAGMASRKPALIPTLFGGRKDVVIKPGAAVAKMQASPAFALDSIGKLFTHHDVSRALHGVARNVREELASPETQKVLGEGVTASPELEGLLMLIVNYIREGMATADRLYPKSTFTIMARTSFTKMFAMMPEHDFFAKPENRELWVELVMRIIDRFPLMVAPMRLTDDRVLNSRFTEVESPGPGREGPQTVETTRREWLTEMPDRDLLSRGTDKRFEGMGGYDEWTDKLVDKVAQVGADYIKANTPPDQRGEDAPPEAPKDAPVDAPKDAPVDAPPPGEAPKPKEAALFELRGMSDLFGKSQDAPIGDWLSKAEEIFDIVEDVNGGAEYAPDAKEKRKPLSPDGDRPATWASAPEPVPRPKLPQPKLAPVSLAPAKGKKKWRWPFG